jgi:Reverse transcriptase (RNA-dependent DNA polymerase)
MRREYSPVAVDPPVTEDQPVIDDQPPITEDQPAVAEEFGREDRTVTTVPGTRVLVPVQVPHPHSTRLQQRRSMADHSLTTSGVPEVKVKLSGSAVESIAAYLNKRKREGTVDPSVKQALKTRGDNADKVIIKELTQMDVLQLWGAVKAQDMSAEERAGVIRSSTFLKRKTHPDDSFDKYKARLVAGGDMQDKKLYEDLSSPTVSTSSVLSIAAIAAHEKRHIAVVGIGSAFLNATMQKRMPVDKTMSEYLVHINPKYAEFR